MLSAEFGIFSALIYLLMSRLSAFNLRGTASAHHNLFAEHAESQPIPVRLWSDPNVDVFLQILRPPPLLFCISKLISPTFFSGGGHKLSGLEGISYPYEFLFSFFFHFEMSETYIFRVPQISGDCAQKDASLRRC